jgi:4a-hydroxytetrahydrobiopterin dehydratase
MNTIVNDLASKQCRPCEGGVPPLSPAQAAALAERLDGWELADRQIAKTFRFSNYYQTMAFFNAIAWI